jgi:hypothetical protein
MSLKDLGIHSSRYAYIHTCRRYKETLYMCTYVRYKYLPNLYSGANDFEGLNSPFYLHLQFFLADRIQVSSKE